MDDSYHLPSLVVSSKEERKGKTLCVMVRNCFITKVLEADFRAGLKDLFADVTSCTTGSLKLEEDDQ
eukprot:scaffold432_cov229-Chaetoceros_neogracile.AAC.4